MPPRNFQTLSISLLIFIWLSFSCIEKPEDISMPIKENKYFLNGMIINQVTLPAYCGVYAFASVVEFEIFHYSDWFYFDKKIPVIITCPREFDKSFFEVGKFYSVKVSTQNQAGFDWWIDNEEVLAKYNLKYKLWAIDVKKLEKK